MNVTEEERMNKPEINKNVIKVFENVACDTNSRLSCINENEWRLYKPVELRIKSYLYNSLHTGFNVFLQLDTEKLKLSITFFEPSDLERLLSLNYGDKKSFDGRFPEQIEEALNEVNDWFSFETTKDKNNLRCKWDISDFSDLLPNFSYKSRQLHDYLCYLIKNYCWAIERTSEWM